MKTSAKALETTRSKFLQHQTILIICLHSLEILQLGKKKEKPEKRALFQTKEMRGNRRTAAGP